MNPKILDLPSHVAHEVIHRDDLVMLLQSLDRRSDVATLRAKGSGEHAFDDG